MLTTLLLFGAFSCGGHSHDRQHATAASTSNGVNELPFVERLLNALQDQNLDDLVLRLPSHPEAAFHLEPGHVLRALNATIASDVPQYFVVIDVEMERFWLLRTGGFAGNTRWWGPAILSAAGDPMPHLDK